MTPTQLKEGDFFAGRYRVVRRIAAGGMGAVYEVVHVETERHRALKVLLPHVVHSEDMRVRFRQEARVAAHIQSEFVVEVFDAGVDETTGMPFLVMELLRGEELGVRVRRLGRISPAEVVTHLHQTALALDKTHAGSIVHRDLKPENLFVTTRDDGSTRIKILDFGVAKILLSGGATGANVTQSLGTPVYMAPEQFKEDPVSAATDTYALGMIAYTLLVGAPYWQEEAARGNFFSFVVTAVKGPLEPASARAQRHGVVLSSAFDAWFARVTAPSPPDRFATASEAVAALAAALGVPLPPVVAVQTDLAGASYGLGAVDNGAALSPTVPANSAGAAASVDTGTPMASSAALHETGRGAPRWHRTRVVVGAGLALVVVAAASISLRHRPSAPAPATSSTREPLAAGMSLVVLPFENVSGRTEDDWLGVGLAESLQAKLGAVPGVHVAPYREVTHGDERPDEKRLRELGVRVLITGSYQRIAERLRIALRVGRTVPAGAAILSTERTGAVTALFELEDSLAVEVATALGQGTGDVQARAQAQGTRNIEALRAYATGLRLLTAGKVSSALRELSRATELDPNFGTARATLERTRAETNHVLIQAHGTVIETVLQQTHANPWVHGGNAGRIRRAWNLEGKELPVTRVKALADQWTHTIDLSGAAPDSSGERVFTFERESSQVARTHDGLSARVTVFTTSSGGEQTFAVQLPEKARIVSFDPLPVEVTEDETGAFVVFREFREPFVEYAWSILFTGDEAVAQRYADATIGERSETLRRGKLLGSREQRTAEIARLREPVLACHLARTGKLDDATALVGKMEAASADYGAFLLGWARACVASARGDVEQALRELEAAVQAGDRPQDLVQTAYLDIIDACTSTNHLDRAARLVGLELRRSPWWQRGAFHPDATTADLERMHAAAPDNDATRYDLALARLEAGRPKDADALVRDRESSTARPYMLELQTRIAAKLGDSAAEVSALRSLVASYPLQWAWTNHAITLAEGGRGDEAVSFFIEQAKKSEFESPVARALALLVDSLDRIDNRSGVILDLALTAPEVNYGQPFRLLVLSRLVGAVSRRADAAGAMGPFFDALQKAVESTKPEVCDSGCFRTRLQSDLCGVKALPPDARKWIEQKAGVPCKTDAEP